jgi:hypothetical protein
MSSEAPLHAIADRMGWRVVKVYGDQGISGGQVEREPTSVRRFVQRTLLAASLT